MAATNVNFAVKTTGGAAPVTPVSVIAKWAVMIGAGAVLKTSDGSRVTTPGALVTAAGAARSLVRRVNGVGTNIALRIRYKSSTTTNGTVTGALFGRTYITEAQDNPAVAAVCQPWERLAPAVPAGAVVDQFSIVVNKANDQVDPDDAAYQFTSVTKACTLDNMGCEEFFAAIEDELVESGTEAILYAKCF